MCDHYCVYLIRMLNVLFLVFVCKKLLFVIAKRLGRAMRRMPTACVGYVIAYCRSRLILIDLSGPPLVNRSLTMTMTSVYTRWQRSRKSKLNLRQLSTFSDKIMSMQLDVWVGVRLVCKITQSAEVFKLFVCSQH